MADLRGTIEAGEIALSAATAKTIVQLVAASNHRVKVTRWGVFFDGTDVTEEPVQVEIVRQSTAGTSSANTPKKLDDSLAESLQTTARENCTAEPTTGDILYRYNIHPQQGYETVYPFGQEIKVGGGGRLGIRCTAPAAVNVNTFIEFEE